MQTDFTLRRQDNGWAIASTGAGLVIMIMAIIWGAQRWDEYWRKRDWQVSAVQVSRFTQAVRAYTGRYYDTLLKAATTTTPVVVTPVMLKNTGFLEQGFSETISSGQQLRAALVRNDKNTDQLQGLVVTQGGSALPYMAVREISIAVSAGLGAYIWESAVTVTGANNSWTMPLAAFGISTTRGHVATLLTTDELSSARQDSDRLYRFAVTGKPDLNRMHTAIDMGGNSVNNADQVNAENDITSNNGWLITKGNKGWINETHGGGFTMEGDDWVKVINSKGLNADRVSTNYVQLEKIEVVGTACAKNGTLARNSLGGGMFCEEGVWKDNKNNTLVSSATISNNSSFICKAGPSGHVLVTAYFNWLVTWAVYWMDASLYANGVLVDFDRTAAFEYDHGRASGTSVTLFHTQNVEPNENVRFSVGATESNLIKVSYSCVGV